MMPKHKASKYIAFLLIPTHHQLSQGLQEISPGQEASCLELSVNNAGCQRKAPLNPSVPLGIPLGQAAPMPESSNDTWCTSELHLSAGWGLLPTICSWLKDNAPSQQEITCAMSSSALNDRDGIFLGADSLEMLSRSETGTLKPVSNLVPAS